MDSKRSHHRKSTARRDGSFVVEFAICLPILLLIFFGLLEYSRLENVRQTAKSSAFFGARQGIVTGATERAMEEAVAERLRMSGVRGAIVNATITDTSSIMEVEIPLAQNTFVPPAFTRDMDVRSRIVLRREGVDVNNL